MDETSNNPLHEVCIRSFFSTVIRNNCARPHQHVTLYAAVASADLLKGAHIVSLDFHNELFLAGTRSKDEFGPGLKKRI
jgi:hypothetical protein